MIKIKANLMFSENLDNCSNLTLFFMKNGKVIGTVYFDTLGCDINIINYNNRVEDFNLMISSGLYEIVGNLTKLKLIEFGETKIIDDKLLPKAIEFVKNKKILCDGYEKDIQDEIDRKMGR